MTADGSAADAVACTGLTHAFGNTPAVDGLDLTVREGEVFGPVVETSVLESRQGRGGLPIAEFRFLNTVGVIFGLGLCLWSLFAWREDLPTRLIALQIFVVVGIVFNAIVTGALSGPFDRYLARVIWLILFVGLVSICCIMRVRSANKC